MLNHPALGSRGQRKPDSRQPLISNTTAEQLTRHKTELAKLAVEESKFRVSIQESRRVQENNLAELSTLAVEEAKSRVRIATLKERQEEYATEMLRLDLERKKRLYESEFEEPDL